MRAVVALLIAAIAALTLSQPIAAADFSDYVGYSFTDQGRLFVGFGPTEVSASDNALQVCQQKMIGNCTRGVAVINGGAAVELMHCPSYGFTTIAFFATDQQLRVDLDLLSVVSEYEFYNVCLVKGEALFDVTVNQWLAADPFFHD